MSNCVNEGNPRWPYGALGMLILTLAIESTVSRHAIHVTLSQRFEWTQSRDAAGGEAAGCQVLGLGTSMTKMGLYSAAVEHESGRRTYNLAQCAGRLPGSYYLLRRALDAGAHPEAILLEVHSFYLAVPFQAGFTAWPELLGPAECLDLAWRARDASFFATTCLTRALPTLRARAEIRTAILSSFGGEAASTRSSILLHERNFTRNSGSFVHLRRFPYQGEVTPHLQSMYLKPERPIDPVNALYLRRILDLCSSRGIRVYWLIPPMIPALLSSREQLGLDADYTRFVEQTRRDYPDLVVLDGRRSGYETPLFLDAAHLHYPGAVAFSGEVGRALRAGQDATPGRSRWVNLPAYRDRPIEAPLEELVMSHHALTESGVIKR